MTTPIAGPCDSPQVVIRKQRPKVLPGMVVSSVSRDVRSIPPTRSAVKRSRGSEDPTSRSNPPTARRPRRFPVPKCRRSGPRPPRRSAAARAARRRSPQSGRCRRGVAGRPTTPDPRPAAPPAPRGTASSQTNLPHGRKAATFRGSRTAPPPSAITTSLAPARLAMATRSASRNDSQPPVATSSRTVRPVCSRINASVSTKRRPRHCANRRPTAVFPLQR